ncbi:hypothetical protein V144x_28440 [Gimesia aquarii]|uniref:Uncharacterized protein n=1 Tax=Gimesia aquarii TaxID=2527964 RepID=A0A517VWJ0_9PLAN|nr:hypothetical protein V144x_28440 [Gimesia aquarii]
MDEKKESRFLRFAYYAIPILLAVYVLSMGPLAVFMCYSDGTARHPEYIDMQESFYAPLAFFVIRYDPLKCLCREYTKFWYINFSPTRKSCIR